MEEVPEPPTESGYGVKTIRQLSRATKAPVGPSPKVNETKENIREYFLEKVQFVLFDAFKCPQTISNALNHSKKM